MKLPQNYNRLSVKERRLVREAYVQIQNGNCSHCKASLDSEPAKEIKHKSINYNLFPPNFFKYPVHLHHSHKTGMTIGAVS